MTPDEAKALYQKARDNRNSLDACPRHKFKDTGAPINFQTRYACEHCGGQLNALEASQYVRGFAAAGGDPESVFPGWYEPIKVTQDENSTIQRNSTAD